MFHKFPWRDLADGFTTGLPQELEPEAYLRVLRRVRGPRTPRRTPIFEVAAGYSKYPGLEPLSTQQLYNPIYGNSANDEVRGGPHGYLKHDATTVCVQWFNAMTRCTNPKDLP